jgi:hypothetical protein
MAVRDTLSSVGDPGEVSSSRQSATGTAVGARNVLSRMSDVLIPTLVPIVVALVGALVTVVYGPILKARRDRRRQAQDLEARYRDALMSSAYALAARLFDISRERLLADSDSFEHDAQAESQGYVHTSTLWMIGRYLAWVELLSRDRYFLALGTTSRGRGMLQSIEEVTKAFSLGSDPSDPYFRLFRAQQSAIAELMIVERESGGEVRSDCLGYATFTSKLEDNDDPVFRRWFATLSRDLEALPASPEMSRRIIAVQHALADLLQFLDETGAAARYPRA